MVALRCSHLFHMGPSFSRAGAREQIKHIMKNTPLLTGVTPFSVVPVTPDSDRATRDGSLTMKCLPVFVLPGFQLLFCGMFCFALCAGSRPGRCFEGRFDLSSERCHSSGSGSTGQRAQNQLVWHGFNFQQLSDFTIH